MIRAFLLTMLALVVGGCNRARKPCMTAKAGAVGECRTPGWIDRNFEIHVPAAWDKRTPSAVVLLLHGGGGNRGNANKTTCPNGDTNSGDCFVALAHARNYVVVIPDGTKSKIGNLRTWNAGGGGTGPHGKRDCVSGRACEENVDDIAYFKAVLDEVERVLPVDRTRVFATGMSNGGAMAHRLACEIPERIAAIVAVTGANQHAYVGGACKPGAAVTQIHGTKDACWPYEGGGGECFSTDHKVSVDESMTAWARLNGCGDTVEEGGLADEDGDGVRATTRRWKGCKRAVVLIRVEGGGHSWPSGHPYSENAGAIWRDQNSDIVLDHLGANWRGKTP